MFFQPDMREAQIPSPTACHAHKPFRIMCGKTLGEQFDEDPELHARRGEVRTICPKCRNRYIGLIGLIGAPWMRCEDCGEQTEIEDCESNRKAWPDRFKEAF